MFTKKWKSDICNRMIHIEGKEDRIEEKINNLLRNKLREEYAVNSYAQNGEDVLIWNLFNKLGIKKPSYIDIGAHHPYEISNTAIFYMNGCRGVNVEANPNLIDEFYKERPDDINICCGVGNHPGKMPFYMIDEKSGRNSFKKERVDEFLLSNSDFELKEVRNIEIKTLEMIIDKVGYMPDYMSIDIEGMEYEVLSQYDLLNKGPKVITLEVMRNNVEYGQKVIRLLEDADYFMYVKIYSNITFVKNEYKEQIYSL